MNSSSSVQNVSTIPGTRNQYSDSYGTALAKNMIIVALGISINFICGMLIHTFRKNQVFYLNPRYILFIHLVVNDMIQLTSAISLFVSSYVFYRINTSLCCIILVFTVTTTLNSPLNLAVMAVECYIAVCFPLRHAELCTIKRIYIIIACIWGLSMLTCLPNIFYLAATEPMLFFSSILCEMTSVLRNSILMKKREVLFIMYLVSVWLVLFYTYIQIFIAARSAKSTNSDAKKGRNTILLHSFQLLLCMLTYIFSFVEQIFFRFFPRIYLHLIFFWYIFVHILPRFLSPIVYGLRDKMFRQNLKKHIFRVYRKY